MKLFNTILIFLFLFIIASCSDTCNENLSTERQVRIKFRKHDKKTFADTTVENVSVFISDTFFYKNASASSISLNLSPLSDTSAFFISTDSVHFDTLYFYYSSKLQMVSTECGFNKQFSLNSFECTKHSVVDTFLIIEKDINKDVIDNLDLIVKTRVVKADTTKTN